MAENSAPAFLSQTRKVEIFAPRES